MAPKNFDFGSLLVVEIWRESRVLEAILKLTRSKPITQSLQLLQQLIGLSNHKSIKVRHYTGGPVDFFGLSCGIRLTPPGLKCVICFLCRKVKVTSSPVIILIRGPLRCTFWWKDWVIKHTQLDTQYTGGPVHIVLLISQQLLVLIPITFSK